MRVVAAIFSEPDQASAACDRLRRELPVADMAVAQLGHPGEPLHGDAVLAGRVTDEQAPKVLELVESADGEIVADIDERWTVSNSSVSSTTPIGGRRHPSEAYLR